MRTMTVNGVTITRTGTPGLYQAEISDEDRHGQDGVSDNPRYHYGSLDDCERWVREGGRSVPPVLDQSKDLFGGFEPADAIT